MGLTSQIDCIHFDLNEHPGNLIYRLSAFVEDYLHRKDRGIAHHDETEGNEELNKATTQCPISNKVVEYVYVHVQLTTDNCGIEV